ncbi:MAG: NlpC/P60 family protein [Aeromonas sp.]
MREMRVNAWAMRAVLALLPLLLAACASAPPTASMQVAATGHGAFEPFYQRWQGVPYRLGGTNQSGLDCSAFTQHAYAHVLGLRLPRTTLAQAQLGEPIARHALRYGDLVFFKTGASQYHVGVYTGDGAFIHVSTRKGVMRSKLTNVYWRKHYWQARRLPLASFALGR